MNWVPQRLHLSTAVLLAFLAGGWMWLNFRARDEIVITPVTFHGPDDAVVVETYMERTTQYGFPLNTRAGHLVPTLPGENRRVELADVKLNIVLNALCGLIAAAAIGLLVETLIHRAPPPDTPPPQSH